MVSVEIPQRQHRTVDGNPYNTIGLFRDIDDWEEVLSELDLFRRKWNPLYSEWQDRIIANGKDTQKWDNVHQTLLGVVDEPSMTGAPGCPECLHSHWRWGTWLHAEGHGQPIQIATDSTQDVDLAIVADQLGQDDPANFRDLVQSYQLIRTFNTAGRSPSQIYLHSAPEEVIYWQAGTGRSDSETFFEWGAFFNPSLPNQQLYSNSGGSGLIASTKKNSGVAEALTSEDGISSVVASQVYLPGNTTVSPFAASAAGPLPAGYTQYGDMSFDVVTTAKIAGPETVSFSLLSSRRNNVSKPANLSPGTGSLCPDRICLGGSHTSGT